MFTVEGKNPEKGWIDYVGERFANFASAKAWIDRLCREYDDDTITEWRIVDERTGLAIKVNTLAMVTR